MNNFEEKTKKQGTSKPEASNEKVNGDMALESEELELDDDELATVVGSDCGVGGPGGYYSWDKWQQDQYEQEVFNNRKR